MRWLARGSSPSRHDAAGARGDLFPETVIGHVEEAVFDAPVATREGEEACGPGTIGWEAGHQVVDGGCDLAGGAPHDPGGDLGDLR